MLLTIILTLIFSTNPADPDREDLLIFKSSHSVEATAEKLAGILNDAGMNVFTIINHQKGAESIDAELRPTRVMLFGNPRAGTPLMQCSQTIGIDLPQKALMWEDERGNVWLAFNNPKYLGERHKISEQCESQLDNAHTALNRFGKSATE